VVTALGLTREKKITRIFCYRGWWWWN
jgi:hypothetical protein